MNNAKFLGIPNFTGQEEEMDQFKPSPLMDELAKQQAPVSHVPDDMVPKMAAQEVKVSDEIQAESEDLMNKLQEEDPRLESLRSLASKYESIKTKSQPEDDLAALQEDAAKRAQILTFAKIGDRLATAYGNRHGGKGQGFGDILDGMITQTQQPIKDYKARQQNETDKLTVQNEKELNDANSDISRFKQQQAVAMAKRLGMNDEVVAKLTGMTAKQLDKLGLGGTGNMLATMKTQQTDYETEDGQPLAYDPLSLGYTNILTGQPHKGPVRRKIISQFIDPDTGEMRLRDRTNILNPTGKKPISEQPKEKEFSRVDLNPKQKELLDKTRDELEKNPQYVAGQEAFSAANSVRDLLANNKVDGVILRGIQNKIARATGEKGAMTENDVKDFGGAQGILDRIARMATYKSNSKIPEADVKFLNNLVSTLEASAKRTIDQVNYVKADTLSKDLQIDLKQAAQLLNTESRMNPKELSKEVKLSEQDKQAIEWAKKNRNNPDAKEILRIHGIK